MSTVLLLSLTLAFSPLTNIENDENVTLYMCKDGSLQPSPLLCKDFDDEK